MFLMESCSLPPREPMTDDFKKGIVSGVAIDTTITQALGSMATKAPSSNMRKFGVALMRECCDRGLDVMTQTYFNERARHLAGSYLGRRELWAKLSDTGVG